MNRRAPLELRPLTNQSRPWDCIICTTSYNNASTAPWETKEGAFVCGDCIIAIFANALNYENNWPPKWGNIPLDIHHFKSLFSFTGDMHIRFHRRELEDERRRENLRKQVEKGVLPGLEGLTRGKHYQHCPKCFKTIELAEACNHITCPCGGSFCYICGKETFDTPETTHWAPGGCPRYGSAGSERAVYDRVDENEMEDQDRPDLEDPDHPNIDMHNGVPLMDTWAWNLAMQTTDPRSRAAMQRLLRIPGYGENPLPWPSFEDVQSAMAAVRAYHPDHGVRPETWRALFEEQQNRIVWRVAQAPSYMTLNRQYIFPTAYGLLSHPVGGVFNLSNMVGRREAFNWAGAQWRNWHAGFRESISNFAVFGLGPGEADMQESASWIIQVLTQMGNVLTAGRLSFRDAVMGRSAVLVRVTGQVPAYEDSVRVVEWADRHLNPFRDLGRMFLQRDMRDPNYYGPLSQRRGFDFQLNEDVRLAGHRQDALRLRLDGGGQHTHLDLDAMTGFDIRRVFRNSGMPHLVEFLQRVDRHAPPPPGYVAANNIATPLLDVEQWRTHMDDIHRRLLREREEADDVIVVAQRGAPAPDSPAWEWIRDFAMQ